MERAVAFDSSGIRFTNYTLTDDTIGNLRNEWQSFVKDGILPYPDHFSGKGIVCCAGGLRYFTCCWVSIHLLRYNGCKLPIELWHQQGELNDEVIDKLKDLNVVCRNVNQYSSEPVEGYQIKPFAIIKSSFKEVLFLDADNNCVTDPAYLFERDDYKKTGAIFWPDFWKTDRQNPIWKIVDSNDYEEYEQESGQILVNKERCWEALNLCLFFNQNRDVYYKLLFGDKDTFKFAWKALRKPYIMVPVPVGHCGYATASNKLFNRGIAMVQHNFEGEIIFIHQNLAKWDVVKEDEHLWQKIKRFRTDAQRRIFIQEEVRLPNGRRNIVFDIDGDVLLSDCKGVLYEQQEFCLETLKKLRSSDFYHRFILELYISRLRGEA